MSEKKRFDVQEKIQELLEQLSECDCDEDDVELIARKISVLLAVRGNPPILALDDGEIILARNSPSAGNWVEIRHDSLTTVYMHLDSINAGITPGARVVKGQQIGVTGTTGTSTGVHLHFEVRRVKNRGHGGDNIDPMPLCNGKRPRLSKSK